MAMIEKWLGGLLAWFAGLFSVSADDLTKDRRGNLPPPEGGVGS